MLTQKRLKELFSYDPETGLFTRLVARGGYKAGEILAGCPSPFHPAIRIDRVLYFAHRLAWLYMTGAFPVHEIDHKDTDPTDNRFSNLREATGAQNRQNLRRPRKDNTFGFLGVTFIKKNGLWRAQISVGGDHKYLGEFTTREQAYDAYLAAKVRLHPYQTLVDKAA